MESPADAREIACPIVLQAVVADKQLLLSFPLAPFTYHVVLAKATGARTTHKAESNKLLSSRFILFPFLLFSADRIGACHRRASARSRSRLRCLRCSRRRIPSLVAPTGIHLLLPGLEVYDIQKDSAIRCRNGGKNTTHLLHVIVVRGGSSYFKELCASCIDLHVDAAAA